jgi:tetratricopeptide (TPR) repeat protein
MSGRLFYQVLLGELYAQQGEDNKGFELMLDAARKNKDEDLYRRSVNIALQTRAGGSALIATRAWREDAPQSAEAARFELQILLALNRTSETGPALKQLVMGLSGADQIDAINSIPSTYANVNDKAAAYRVATATLQNIKGSPALLAAVQTSLGRLAMLATQFEASLQHAEQAHRADPTAEWPALLALSLMELGQARAEALVISQRAATSPDPQSGHTVTLAHARVLLNQGRLAEAQPLLQTLEQRWPQVPETWLLQGTLHAQGQQPALAQAALERYLGLLKPDQQTAGQAQARLQLATLAEQRGDWSAALAQLDHIGLDQVQLSTQIRRASILRQQGQLDAARQAIRNTPLRRPDDARLVLLAEAQLLRDAKSFEAAMAVYAQGAAQFPTDPDFVYEQASMAEKLQRYDEMERLLRGLIQQHPNNAHAHNALGYSLADRGVQLSEARRLIEIAVALSPKDGYILDSLGWVQFRQGQIPEALITLKRAFEMQADAEIAAHWGEVLWVSGQTEAAQAIWQEGLKINPNNETLRQTLQRLNRQP